MSTNMTIENAFGVAVREERTRLGMSQEQLSFESGLDRSFISQVECGHKQPSLVTIFQLAKALSTTPSGLLAIAELNLKS